MQQLPKEVTQGVITVQPSADVDSPAYAAASKRLGIAAPDSYEAQATDWISIVALTIAKAGQADRHGDPRHRAHRSPTATGKKFTQRWRACALLKAGKDDKYSGASGPCAFTDIGDITDCKFRFNRVDRRRVQVHRGGERCLLVPAPLNDGFHARDYVSTAIWLL